MTTTVNTSSRNFYATKPNSSGKDVPYAFESVSDRDEWVKRHENSKPVTAFDVYRMLHKSQHDVLVANRQNRVVRVTSHDNYIPKKGQRLLLRS